MAYTDINFKTKKALKEAVKAGKQVTIYQPGGLSQAPTDCRAFLEGPHYPQPHRWYAQVTMQDGLVVSVK